jgi:hypothetical protein
MSAGKIEAALKSVSPEPILCWCYGQSLEARYSARSAGGAAGAAGAAIGQAVLSRRLAKVRSADAVPLPAAMVVAVSASRILFFHRRSVQDGPVAALQRDQVQAVHRGHFWHRLDLTSSAVDGRRVYTVMVLGPGRGPRRLRQVIRELGRSGAQALR